MLGGIWQIGDADLALRATVAPTQVLADSALGGCDIGVVTGVENPPLNIAEECLDGVVIGAACRERDPMQVQPTHLAAGLARLTRVGRVAIEHDPDRLAWIPGVQPLLDLN
jgi:hypothetical protein